MKILFLTRSFYPHIGGVEKHVFQISKKLVELGHTVTVITEEQLSPTTLPQSGDNNEKKAESIAGIRVFRIPITTTEKMKKYQIWYWLWRHAQLIQQADVVHAHDVFFWYLPFRMLYPTKKIYTTFHGYETVYPPQKTAIFMRKISRLFSYKTINVGEYIKKWYGTPADSTLYGGVSLPSTFDEQKNKNGLSILFLGRIEDDTGIIVYEEVLKQLDKKNVAYTFSAVGDGSLRKKFERFGNVLGMVDEVSVYVEKADIIFASSYLSILEAFSYSKLVMSVYRNPLKKDYLVMTPFSKWIIISDEAQKITAAISEYQQDKENFYEYRKKSYDWVKEQTWTNITQTYLKLWEND